MKISLKWLKDYVKLTAPPEVLAEKLTMAGTEVAHLDIIGGWENVWVGQLVAVNPHPNADRLRLATVDVGGEQETVVCGAPNLTIGDKIAFARVGAILIDGHTGQESALKPATIRGVTSRGMVCSEKELGLSDNHETILVLPPDAPLGAKLSDYLGDAIFELEVTPNRPDMLSVIGVAHEVGALTAGTVSVPPVSYEAPGLPIEKQVSVEILDSELCPRYCASLITDVKIGESPRWLKGRLTASGMRPINNVVDITNYVMLEYGQPLHAFDFEKITAGKVIIRRARDGETMVTLDDVERKLTAETLVIADPRHAIAIAGVMGGATSEVSDCTTTVLLESASFKPASIHYTSTRLGLRSEASMRFERGISPAVTLPAVRRATQLMIELAGGKAAQGIIDAYPGQKKPELISLTSAEVKRILGFEVSPQQIEKTLVSLGFEVKKGQEANEFVVSPPYWRSDIHLAADVIEEIARVMGYEHIPSTLLSRPLPQQNPNPMLGLKKKVRQTLAGFGFEELITYSLTSRDMLEKGLNAPLVPEPLRLANPMTAEQECLRTSLRGNMLAALAGNLRHQEGVIFLFELGHVYLPKPLGLPDEPEMLCGILTSTGVEKAWHGRQEPVDFFDAKGAVEGLMAQLGVAMGFEASMDAGLRPGRQAAILAGGNKIGVLGEIHPRVAQAFEVPSATYLFELNLMELLPHTLDYRSYEPLPRFPSVVRDLALVVDEEVSHRQVSDIIQVFSLVKQVRLFDVYSGKQVATGKKSLAYSLTFQSPDHTLTDVEVDGVLSEILKGLSAQLGAVLRG